MLGKLIKNEVKSSAHYMLGIYAAVVVTVGVMALAALSDQLWLGTLAALAMLFLSVILLAMTVVCILVNFNKTLYSNQGYLSFSLPVSGGALLGSKVIVAVLWLVVSFVTFFGMMAGTTDYVTKVINKTMGEQNMEMIKMLVQMFQQLPSKSALIFYALYLVVSIFVFCFLVISVLFFSSTLANTRPFQKKATLWMIAFGLGISLILVVLNSQLMMKVPLSVMADTQGLHVQTISMAAASDPFTFGIAGTIFFVLSSLLLICGTSMLMNSKVNIR